MKKKIISMLAVTGLCAGILTGCGNLLSDYNGYVTLGQYEGVEYTQLSTEVTDEELQAQVDAFLQQCGESEEVATGTVAMGDTINLDYIGYCDGVAFEGGDTQGNGTTLTIGSHSYIDDFEDQLVGHEVGEEGIEVNVSFPDPYPNNPDLAGKPATFVCKINSIIKVTYPEELTDDLVAANTNYDTVNSYMDALKMDYESYKQDLADKRMKADLIMKVIDNATINSYPEDELNKLVEQTIEAAQSSAESSGMDFETYVSYYTDENGNPYTIETYKQGAEDYMKELLNEKMVICAIAKEQGYTVGQKDIDEYIAKEVAQNSGMSEEYFNETYSQEELAYAAVYDKVMDHLIETAVPVSE
ncbi:MAG: FKBP-type peptidyl-prolyl cis-trans isomerase [Lachnospiraceae bacterium]|nr:FKBP-type peptidyl-prolyl cis-trans isomerase [Lachnospiraceae bacterium]